MTALKYVKDYLTIGLCTYIIFKDMDTKFTEVQLLFFWPIAYILLACKYLGKLLVAICEFLGIAGHATVKVASKGAKKTGKFFKVIGEFVKSFAKFWKKFWKKY